MKVIADETVIYSSPVPEDVYCYTPWITDGFSGRLVLSFDISGPGLHNLPGPKSDRGDYDGNQCKVYVSDDQGETWAQVCELAMLHARVFKAGDALYIIGHAGDLLISKSMDNGDTWSEPVVLDDKNCWHQSGGSIDYHNGKIYLTMEHEPYPGEKWAGGDPVLMSASVSDDLTDIASWKFSNKLEFAKTITGDTNLFGINPVCWLESSVVRVYDPEHELYDPEERTVLLFLRLSGCGINNYAGILAGRENPDGSLILETVKQKDSNTPLIYIPFPGGYMKFQIVYDEKTKLYWLVASQAVYSSLRKKEALPNGVFGERRRLELFYSQNLIDWCSAGLVSVGPCDAGSRHYASLMINGDDILVLSRSGDERSKDCHDTNLITLHKVKNFRDLVI